MPLFSTAEMSSFWEILLYMIVFTSTLITLVHTCIIIISIKSYPLSMKILPLPFLTLIMSFIWSFVHTIAISLVIGGIYLGLGRSMSVYELMGYVLVLALGVVLVSFGLCERIVINYI